MKKHSLAFMLIAALVLSIPVQAAEESASNFVRIHTYSDQFSDLDLDQIRVIRNEGSVTNLKDRRRDLYTLKWRHEV